MRLLYDPAFVYPLALGLTGLVLAGVLWRLRARRARHLAGRRAAGYRLMDCLKAYTVWIDWQRDEPPLQQNADGGLPPALAEALQIQDEHFPELASLLLQLLHAHRELVQYLREDGILRMAHVPPLRTHFADPRYQDLRDRQDATLDGLFVRCRQLIGDAGAGWQRTRSDFSFSSSGLGLPP